MTSISAYAFGLSEIILLFAVPQSLLLAVVLLSAPGRPHFSNGQFCAFLLVLSLILVECVLVNGEVTLLHPHLLGISLPAYFVLAPLYFLYARTLTGRSPKLVDGWHLLPVLAGILAATPFYLLPAWRKSELLLQLTGDGFTSFPLLAILFISLISFQTVIYFYQTYDSLEKYEAAAEQESASVSLLAAHWLKRLSVAFCLFVVVFYLAAAELFFLYQYRQTVLSPDLFIFGVAGFIFWVSWHMYRHPELFALYTPGSLPQADRRGGRDAKRKYEKTVLAPELLAKYEVRLWNYMSREQPYLDGELRLSQLAECLEMPAHHLSQVINVTRRQTFFDFINEHRIRHAQDLLLQRDRPRNLLQVALESGFNSKASFNRVFKKETGMTPSTFQNQRGETGNEEYLAR